MFSKYHYLGHTHNNAARVFVGFVEKIPVAFYSVLPFPHPKLKNARRTHRLVILPDYQGIGIGSKIHNYIAEFFTKMNYTFVITTSSPQVINSSKKSKNWVLTSIGRKTNHQGLKTISGRNNSSSRITTSWKYKLTQ